MNDFPARVVRAGTDAVDRTADRICKAATVLPVSPRAQYAMAAEVTALRMAAEERLSPEQMVAVAERIERWLVDASRPTHLRVVRERKAS